MRRRDAIRHAAATPLAFAAIGAPAGQAQTRFVRIATAGSGGSDDRLGSGLAAVWNDTVPGMRASIQATGGTVQNLDLLAGRLRAAARHRRGRRRLHGGAGARRSLHDRGAARAGRRARLALDPAAPACIGCAR